MNQSVTPPNQVENIANKGQAHQHGSTIIQPGDIAVGVVIGRASEYFDFFVFAIASVLVFPKVFFPFTDALTATLYSFLLFSFAFIARPFGTVLMMKVQRDFGRQTKLTCALLLMGASTAGIAFLPSYENLGIAAIALLALFRFAQGIALGGSWDGMPSLLALNAPKNQRGWYAMIGQLGAPLGFFIATGLFAYLLHNLSMDDFLTWGWRYPFFVAFAINVVALFARLQLVAANEVTRALEDRELQPVSTSEMVKRQGYNILVGALAALASYALFHVVTVFPLSWIHLFSNTLLVQFLLIQMLGAVLAAGGIVVSGLLADRFGRRTTLGWVAITIALFSAFVPLLLDNGPVGQTVFVLIGFLLLGLSYGQAAGAVTNNFKPRYRYTGAALTSDLAWLAGAAFAPLVTLGLSAHFGLAYVSLYLLSGAVCSLAALSLNKAFKDEIRS